jgi:hypothetical protein
MGLHTSSSSSMDPLTGRARSDRLGHSRWAPHHGSRVEEGELLPDHTLHGVHTLPGQFFVEQSSTI